MQCHEKYIVECQTSCKLNTFLSSIDSKLFFFIGIMTCLLIFVWFVCRIQTEKKYKNILLQSKNVSWKEKWCCMAYYPYKEFPKVLLASQPIFRETSVQILCVRHLASGHLMSNFGRLHESYPLFAASFAWSLSLRCVL